MATVARLVIQASADVAGAMAQLTALNRRLEAMSNNSSRASAAVTQHTTALRDFNNQIGQANTHLNNHNAALGRVHSSNQTTTRSTNSLGQSFRNTGNSSAGFYTWMLRLAAVFGSELVPATALFGGALVGLTASLGAASLGVGVFGAAIIAGFMAAKKGAAGSEEFAAALDKLKKTWYEFGTNNAATTIPLITKAIDILAVALAKLSPLVKAMGPIFNIFLDEIGKFVKNGALDRLVAYLSREAPLALDAFGFAFGNMLIGLGNVFKLFMPYGQQLLENFEHMMQAFAAWSRSADAAASVAKFLGYIQGTGRDAWEALKAVAEALLHVLSALRPFQEALIPVTKAVADLVSAMPPWLIQAIVAAWLGFKAISAIVGIFSAVSAAAATLTQFIVGLRVALATFQFVAAAFGISSLALLGWIALIAAAVAGLVVGIYFLWKNWDTVWNGIKATAGAVWDFLGSKWGWVIAVIGPVGWMIAIAAHWQEVWGIVQTVASTVWGFLTAAWQVFVNAFLVVWNAFASVFMAIWSPFWNALAAAAQVVWNAIQVAWGVFINALTAIWNAFVGPLQDAWNRVWPELLAAAQAVWNQISFLWNLLWTGALIIWNNFSGAFMAVWTPFWNVVTSVAQAAWNLLVAAWQTFWNTVQGIFSTGSGVLGSAWNAFWTVVSTFAQGVWNAISAAWQLFWNLVTTIFNNFSSAFSSAWNTFWNAVKTIAQGIWDVIKGLWQAFVDAVVAILLTFLALFTGHWQTAWNAIKQFGLDIWNLMRVAFQAWCDLMNTIFTGGLNTLKAIWSGAWNTIHDVFVTIKDRISGVMNDFWGFLRTGFDAAANGIKSVWDKVMGFVGKPVTWIIDAVWNKVLGPAWNLVNNIWGGDDLPTNINTGGFATGGYVSGPGTATSDSIPAYLSNGEYVMKASAVRKYGIGAMQAMNAGALAFANGGLVQGKGYADGGPVTPGSVDLGTALAMLGIGQNGTGGDNSVKQPEKKKKGGGGILGTGLGPDVGPDVVGAVKDAVSDVVAFGIKFVRGAAAEGWDKLTSPIQKFADGMEIPGIKKDSWMGKMIPGIVRTIIKSIRDVIKGKDDEANSLAGGFVPFRAWKAGDEERVTMDGKTVNKRTKEMIENAEKLLKKNFTVLQGSYNAGGVAASAGTHDGGGVVDLAPFDNNAIAALRASGFAAWHRTVAEGFSGDHAHAVAVGDPTVSPAAAAQVASFFRGRNGLANDGPDTFVPAAGAIPAALGAWINAAMAATGVSGADWVKGLQTLIMRESAGNPKAQNNSDSNAAKGTPSKGLAQVIDPTFRTFHQAGTSNDIFDPVANIAAAINYIKAVYGGIGNVQQANPNLPPKGYWRGGIAHGWSVVGEKGPELMHVGSPSRVFPNDKIGGNGSGVYIKEAHFHGSNNDEIIQDMEWKLRTTGMGKRLGGSQY